MIKVYLRNIFTGLAFVLVLSSAIMSASGPGAGYTNAPNESNCTSCHSGSIITSGNSNLNNFRFKGNFTGNGYIPDSTYTLEVTFKQSGISKFGFEITCLDNTNSPAGTFTSTNGRTSKTTAVNGGKTREYIQHTSTGTASVGTDSTRWTFEWKAPSANLGKLTFYAVVMATNSNSNNGGDAVYGKQFQISPSGLLPVANPHSKDSITCAGYTIQLNGGASNTPTSFSWKLTGGTPASSTAQNPTVTYTTAGTKQAILTVRNSKGVSLPDTMNIVVNATPPAVILNGAAASVCQGDSLLLNANTSTNPPVSYLWLHNNKTSRSVYVKDTGNYQVKVTANTNGCARTSAPFKLSWYPRPGISIVKSSASDSFCESYADTFTASGTAIDSVYWYLNGVLSRRTKSLSTVFSGTTSVNVTAVAKSINACKSDLSNTLVLKRVPRLFPSAFTSSKTTSTISLSWKKTSGISAYTYKLNSGNFQSTSSDTTLELSGLQPNTFYNITIRSMQASPCGFSDSSIRIRTNACSNLAFSVALDPPRVCAGEQITVRVTRLFNARYSLAFNNGVFGKDTTFSFTPVSSDSLRIDVIDSLSPTCPPITEKYAYAVDTLIDADTASGAKSVSSCTNTYTMTLLAGYSSYRFFKNNALVTSGAANTYTFTGLSSGDKLTAEGIINTCSRTYGPVSFTLNPLPVASYTFARNWKTYTFTADAGSNSSYLWKTGSDVLGNTATFSKDMSAYNLSNIKVSLITESASGCRDSSEQTIAVPDMLSLNAFGAESFRLYPNPFNTFLNAEHSAGAFEVLVNDHLGRAILQLYTTESVLNIPTYDLPQGVYHITLRSEQGLVSTYTLNKL